MNNMPDYSVRLRKDVPIEDTWNLEDIYVSVEDWENEKNEFKNNIEKIESYQTIWIESAEKMLEFLELLNHIEIIGGKLSAYASFRNHMDLSNPQFIQMRGELHTIFVNLSASLSFVDEDLLKLGQNKFYLYLKKEPKLAPYQFGIEKTFRLEKHILPQSQKRIVALTGLFSGATSKASNMLNDVEIPPSTVKLSNGLDVVLNYSNYAIYRGDNNCDDRRLVMHSFWQNQKKFENTFAILLDSAIKQHFFKATVHHYPNCLAAQLAQHNISPDVYGQLIKTVKANLEPLHRFLRIKAKLLKLADFKYEDIYSSAVKDSEKFYTYNQAKDIVCDSLKPLGEEYGVVLQRAFSERWIDKYPNKGKQSGAYSSGVYGVHPYVKMNFNGKFDAVTTLTHELGHAMHSFLSDQNQHFALSHYPIFLAEIASTFNEVLLIDYLLKEENDPLTQLYILSFFIEQFRATVYRQTLFAEFELAMHQLVEEGKTLTADWLNDLYLKLTREYYGHAGGVMEVGDFIANEWSLIPHFYMNYYVFNYSTGLIAAFALSDMVLNNQPNQPQAYLGFLSAGGSDYPLEILKKAGVDMTASTPYNAAFSRLSKLVLRMEQLAETI